MFERFTYRAREVVVLAQDEARTLKHNYIGTEHILLGLLREEEGFAARVLDTLDITVEDVRAQVARIVGQGDKVTTGQMPFTAGAKQALESSLSEALELGHEQIDTQHILLGVLGVDDGVGAKVLCNLDADPVRIRDEIVRMLSGPSRHLRARTDTYRGTDTASETFFIAAKRGENSLERRRYGETPRLIVACPHCATPIVAVTSDQRSSRFQVSMQGDHTCPECERRWAMTATAAWTDPSPPGDPEDDLPSEFTAWHHPEPAHFAMSCFRCDYVLERVALDDTTTPALRLEADTDRSCPVCNKHWRIAYDVSWEERPSGSSSRPQGG